MSSKEDYTPLIMYFKLKSGDEVVSEVMFLDEDDELDVCADILMSSPYKISSYIDTDETQNDRQVMFLSPWLPIGIVKRNECVLQLMDVICYAEITDKFLELYLEAAEQNAKEYEEDAPEPSKIPEKPKKIGDNVFSAKFGKQPETGTEQ